MQEHPLNQLMRYFPIYWNFRPVPEHKRQLVRADPNRLRQTQEQPFVKGRRLLRRSQPAHKCP